MHSDEVRATVSGAIKNPRLDSNRLPLHVCAALDYLHARGLVDAPYRQPLRSEVATLLEYASSRPEPVFPLSTAPEFRWLRS